MDKRFLLMSDLIAQARELRKDLYAHIAQYSRVPGQWQLYTNLPPSLSWLSGDINTLLLAATAHLLNQPHAWSPMLGRDPLGHVFSIYNLHDRREDIRVTCLNNGRDRYRLNPTTKLNGGFLFRDGLPVDASRAVYTSPTGPVEHSRPDGWYSWRLAQTLRAVEEHGDDHTQDWTYVGTYYTAAKRGQQSSRPIHRFSLGITDWEITHTPHAPTVVSADDMLEAVLVQLQHMSVNEDTDASGEERLIGFRVPTQGNSKDEVLHLFDVDHGHGDITVGGLGFELNNALVSVHGAAGDFPTDQTIDWEQAQRQWETAFYNTPFLKRVVDWSINKGLFTRFTLQDISEEPNFYRVTLRYYTGRRAALLYVRK